MKHPFADLINLHVEDSSLGASTLSLVVDAQHLNPHGVVHGAVLYALADTGMGTALYPSLDAGEICATIEIKINYFKSVTAGKVVCKATIVNRGKSVANLEARLYSEDTLLGIANGNFAIFRPRAAAT